MLRTYVLSLLARDCHFSTCATTSGKLSKFQVRDSVRTINSTIWHSLSQDSTSHLSGI